MFSHNERGKSRFLDVSPPLAQDVGHSTARNSTSGKTWSLRVIISFLTLICLLLVILGTIQYPQIGQSQVNMSEPMAQSSGKDIFLDSSPEPPQNEFHKSVREVMNERYDQNSNRFSDEDSEEKYLEKENTEEEYPEEEKKDNYVDMTKIERIGLTSCRATRKGIQYKGKVDFLEQIRNITYMPCTSWSFFDLNTFLKKHSKMDKKLWSSVDPKKLRKNIQPRLKKTFEKAARSSYWCRNFGGLFDEPSCLVSEADLEHIENETLWATPIVSHKGDEETARLVPCGVPSCPPYFGPHAGKQCIVTPPGADAQRRVCHPFRGYVPQSPLRCDHSDKTAGPTYKWTHPTQGYSLTIPTAATPCHNLRRPVLIKGGYLSRTWFELPTLADHINLKISPYSDERPVELIMQYRYSADREDEGYNVGLTSRHFNIMHAQHLVHLSKGHVPVVTDFPSLFYMKEVQMKHVQYEAKDVIDVMNAGTVTDVTFKKRGQEAHLSFQDNKHSIEMTTPSETNRFPQFVRMFSDEMVEVQINTYCPIVHVFENEKAGEEITRDKSKSNHQKGFQVLEFPILFPFRHHQEGVYFRLQRKKHSTSMIFYHYYNAGLDDAKVFLSTFAKLRSGITLYLKPPYQFKVTTSPSDSKEWENRERGSFETRDLDIGWHGYNVRLTKTKLTLHHIGSRGKATLIYRASFFRFQPPFLYAFFQASGGKFTVNCQPRYEEYIKSRKGSRKFRLSFTGQEYVGLKTTSRSGRLCVPSQHSSQGLCRTWDLGKMLYHGPCCRVLNDKDLDIKLEQLGITGGQEQAIIKKNMSWPESPFFGFGFESCGVPHKYENDPSFHYFSVLYPEQGLESSELIDVRTIGHGKLEFGYISAGNTSSGMMSILFLDKFSQKRMQIIIPVFKKYIIITTFQKEKVTRIRYESYSRFQLTTGTNYSHCELQMSASDVLIFCWDFNTKSMQQALSLIRYDQMINDKRRGILQYISFGTMKFNELTSSLNFLKPSDKSSQIKPTVNMWRVRLSCSWFEVPASTASHLRPLRLEQEYYLYISQDSGNVSINFYNSAFPKNLYERPLEISFIPEKVVNIRLFNEYSNITHEYKSFPLEHNLTFSISKLDTKLWLSVVVQLCPQELRAILKDRRATQWTNTSKERIIFITNIRSQRVLWKEGGLINTASELKRINLTLEWFPQECWAKIPINTYVVVVRNSLRMIKYVIQVDDNRSLDGATLEYFSIQAHSKSAAFSLSNKPCTPLNREQLGKKQGGHFVVTSRGICSKTCGGGFRLLEYVCIRPLNGDLCNGSELGLPKHTFVDKVKIWRSCNMHECYNLRERLQDIIITNMTVALGQQIILTCLDKDYMYRIKENMPTEAVLKVHWFKNERHYHLQTNSITVKVLSIEDTGLFHCYVRYNHEIQDHPIKIVGITPDKNERYAMIFDKYEFEMRADNLLFVLQYRVMASWFHRRHRNDTYQKLYSSFMSTTETHLVNELKEDELGEYLGCIKPFPAGIPSDAFKRKYGDYVMACPFFVQLVSGSYKEKMDDFISMLPTFEKKYWIYILIMLVNMCLLEHLIRWLYTRRKIQKMDFNSNSDLVMKYGETRMFSLGDYQKKKNK
ncbi:hypothetical protein E2C01_013866 [Portunus trituberculatus]|uniref:Ig-like domain-containing protein n=1 Tax=Portunus trituberculatus TaxID=210409 RepID=A0A5B7DHC4_PORTR|nr:hypothetical protein [Portunus trituberculatus]